LDLQPKFRLEALDRTQAAASQAEIGQPALHDALWAQKQRSRTVGVKALLGAPISHNG
jgi:hypothetical protein